MVICCEAFVSICVGPRRSRRSLCRAPALSVLGPALSRSLRQAPAVSVSGPGPLCVCVEPRRSLCRAPALSASGSCALWVDALCVGPRRSRPALSRSLCRDLCRAPGTTLRRAPVFASDWRSLHRPALSVSGAAALSLPVSALSVLGPSGPPPLRGTLCVGLPARHPPSLPPIWSAGPQLGSACHPSRPVLRAPNSDPRATHPARRVPLKG